MKISDPLASLLWPASIRSKITQISLTLNARKRRFDTRGSRVDRRSHLLLRPFDTNQPGPIPLLGYSHARSKNGIRNGMRFMDDVQINGGISGRISEERLCWELHSAQKISRAGKTSATNSVHDRTQRRTYLATANGSHSQYPQHAELILSVSTSTFTCLRCPSLLVQCVGSFVPHLQIFVVLFPLLIVLQVRLNICRS